uniref:Uncharacterized protein n=1 Tax=Setaria viridis TaxID=4556 RepID=A0A4V6D9N8_SETVI|nr:hypothetical protein SEVIR_3G184000v2 [Setaria viridis]
MGIYSFIFKPYHIEYAAPREPSCTRQSYVENDRFEQKDRSSVQKKKKVVKKVYRVERDGRKDKSSDLNSISEKPINKKLQKLSAQELRKKGMVRVPKGSIQIQNKVDVQAKGATQLKEKRKFER